MKTHKRGIFIGKFYPLHLGHVSSIVSLADMCDEAYLVFYNDENAERRLAEQFGHDYVIDLRIKDAKEVLKNISNVRIVRVDVPQAVSFPDDYQRIKDLVEEQIGGPADLQIFGSEERDIYVPFKYAHDYILGSMYVVETKAKDLVSLHATLVRNDYAHYKDFLPSAVRQAIHDIQNK